MNKIWLIAVVVACGLVAGWTLLRAQTPTDVPVSTELSTQPPAWLHVEVETNWAWFWQKSKGRAWVTAGKNDTTHVKVGRLCIRLAAHGAQDSCAANADEITIREKRRGVQIAKKTAIVTAWTESPSLDTVTVRMEP